jgi:hypothetical protein
VHDASFLLRIDSLHKQLTTENESGRKQREKKRKKKEEKRRIIFFLLFFFFYSCFSRAFPADVKRMKRKERKKRERKKRKNNKNKKKSFSAKRESFHSHRCVTVTDDARESCMLSPYVFAAA